MKILFDLSAVQPIEGEDFNGGAEYAKTVFSSLIKSQIKQKLLAFYNPGLPIDAEIMNECNGKVVLFPVKNLFQLKELIEGENIDRVYSAIPYRYHSLDFMQAKFIFTLHGLRTIEVFTDEFEYKYVKGAKGWLRFFIKKVLLKKFFYRRENRHYGMLLKKTPAENIIVPSLHTKYAIKAFFPDFPDVGRVRMLYSPIKKQPDIVRKMPAFFSAMSVKEKRFALLISGNRWIKNAYRAIMAFDQVCNTLQEDFKLVVTGDDGPNYFREIKNKNRFVFSGYVSNAELEYLYANAYFFIYPTLNEGFGYPPLEAMKYGIPVLVSNTASIPEILGDAAVYFNPYSIDEIENRILQIMFSDSYSEICDKSIKRYQDIASLQNEMLDELVKVILDEKEN